MTTLNKTQLDLLESVTEILCDHLANTKENSEVRQAACLVHSTTDETFQVQITVTRNPNFFIDEFTIEEIEEMKLEDLPQAKK